MGVKLYKFLTERRRAMTVFITLDCGDELEIKGVVSVREKGGMIRVRRQNEDRKCTIVFYSDEIKDVRLVIC